MNNGKTTVFLFWFGLGFAWLSRRGSSKIRDFEHKEKINMTSEKDNEFGLKRRLKYLRESNEFGMTSEDNYNF